jgi:predicted nucleic acid-binding protein
LKLLFDASSIAEILAEQMEGAVDTLAEESTLDLAIYELGNMVWKESRSKKRAEDEASTLVGYVGQVLGVMDVQRVQLEDMQMIERNAVRLNVSFYDSSYLTIAMKGGRALVTEDEQLRRVAKETGVPCLSFKEAILIMRGGSQK